MSGFDAGGVDGEPAGGFEFFVFEEGFVGGFELIGGDGEGEPYFSGEIETVDDEVGVVEVDCRVGVRIDRFGFEELEGEGAVDGDPVEGVVDGDLDVFCEDEGVEGVGGWFGEVFVEADEGGGVGFDDAEVGVDTALAVEPEGVEGLSGCEVVDFCGEHVVEEGVAFGTCDFEGAHVGFVEEDGGFAEGGVFHIELAEGFDDGGLEFWWAVGDEEGFGGLMDGMERGVGAHKCGW